MINVRFCCTSVRQSFAEEGASASGLVLTLLPALRLENLLPLELHYRAADARGNVRATATVAPGDTCAIHEVTCTSFK